LILIRLVVLPLSINPAARVGFADGDLVDNLPKLIGKISFVLLVLWLNG
jgi:hypothetical protein